MSRVLDTRLGDHAREDRVRVIEQVLRGVVFCDLTLVHHQDSISNYHAGGEKNV